MLRRKHFFQRVARAADQEAARRAARITESSNAGDGRGFTAQVNAGRVGGKSHVKPIVYDDARGARDGRLRELEERASREILLAQLDGVGTSVSRPGDGFQQTPSCFRLAHAERAPVRDVTDQRTRAR